VCGLAQAESPGDIHKNTIIMEIMNLSVSLSKVMSNQELIRVIQTQPSFDQACLLEPVRQGDFLAGCLCQRGTFGRGGQGCSIL
jgi:hypothetical protein